MVKSVHIQKSYKEYTRLRKAFCIDDFILYNDECVFGRVEPKPKKDGYNDLSICLSFKSAGTELQLKGYKNFFIHYWPKPYSYTFGELFNLITKGCGYP